MMHGLGKAGLLFAPIFASAVEFTTPIADAQAVHVSEGGSIVNFSAGGPLASHALALIKLQSNDGSPRDEEFKVEVLPSDKACGYGNVLVNGEKLQQESKDGIMSGQGSVASSLDAGPIFASWNFECLTLEGQEIAQLLKFKVKSNAGRSEEDNGFALSFKQTGTTEIIRIERSLSKNDLDWLQNGRDEQNHEEQEEESFPEFDFDSEMMELESLRAEVDSLLEIIRQKERTLEEHRWAKENNEAENDIKKCDSLKCIMQLTIEKARGAAHVIYGKIAGEGFYQDFDHEKPRQGGPRRRPFGLNRPHKAHGNAPQNGSCHGNSTIPPPPRFDRPGKPHRRPDHHHGSSGEHHDPPPPFNDGDGFPGPPHRHHGPPPSGEHYGPSLPHHGPPPPGEHYGPPPFGDEEDFRGPPHHHRPPFPPFDGEDDFPHHGEDDREDGPRSHHPHGPPPPPFDHEERPHHGQGQTPDHDHHGPPSNDKQGPPPPPSNGESEPSEGSSSSPSSPDNIYTTEMNEKAHRGPHSPDHPQHPDRPHHPDFPHGPFGEEGEHGPDRFHGPPPPPPPHPFLDFLKFLVGGFMFAILLLTLHRRHLRNARLANRRPNFISRFISARFSIGGNGYSDRDGDEEEKAGLVMNHEEVLEGGMDSEIEQLRNVAGVVGDIVAAEEGRFIPSISSSSSEQPRSHHQDFMRMGSLPGYRAMGMGMGSNMTGIEEDADEIELPAYEDNDGSEAASLVQDGFGGYTPSLSGSESSTLHEVLGAPKN